MTMPREVARLAPSGVAFSTRERGIAQGSSAVNAMKITNRYVAFGQRPATREALGRRALPRSQGEHAPATRSGVDFSTGDVASGRKARGGVLELTLGCGSRAQSQRAGGNRGKRKSRRLGEQAPRRSIGKREGAGSVASGFSVRRFSSEGPSSSTVCPNRSHTKFELPSSSCSYEKFSRQCVKFVRLSEYIPIITSDPVLW